MIRAQLASVIVAVIIITLIKLNNFLCNLFFPYPPYDPWVEYNFPAHCINTTFPLSM